MPADSTSCTDRLRGAGMVVQGITIGAVLLLAYGLVAPVAWRLDGIDGLIAAVAAMGLCLVGAGAALGISHAFQDPKQAATKALLGMLPRMGIPLFGGTFLHFFSERLAQQGFLYYLLVFYMIALPVEVALTLPSTDQTPPGGESDSTSDASQNTTI